MRVYTASLETGSVSTARSLMLLENPTDTALLIIGASVVAPDDDANEQMDIALQTITTFGTPTGTSVTPAPHSPGDSASGVTVTGNITADEPTYTTSTEIGHEGSSSVGGWRYDPGILERAMEVSPNTDIGLRLLAAPDAAKTLVVRITFIEIGG